MKEDRLIKNKIYVDAVKDDWVKIFGELTYVGFGKDELYESFNGRFGSNNWLPAHYFDEQVTSRYEGYLMYDESYYHFLKGNLGLREWIVNTASEVIDYDMTNIDSGLDLSKQEGEATHLQDISVRRALTRLVLEEQGIPYDIENLPNLRIFRGNRVVQIRGHKTEGFSLNPGQVPFYKPELIIGEHDPNVWWLENSAEDAYQRNKVLLVNPASLNLKASFVSEDGLYLSRDPREYYLVVGDKSLVKKRGKGVRRLASEGKLDNWCEIKDSPLRSFESYGDLVQEILKHIPKFEKKRISYEELEKMAGVA